MKTTCGYKDRVASRGLCEEKKDSGNCGDNKKKKDSCNRGDKKEKEDSDDREDAKEKENSYANVERVEWKITRMASRGFRETMLRFYEDLVMGDLEPVRYI